MQIRASSKAWDQSLDGQTVPDGATSVLRVESSSGRSWARKMQQSSCNLFLSCSAQYRHMLHLPEALPRFKAQFTVSVFSSIRTYINLYYACPMFSNCCIVKHSNQVWVLIICRYQVRSRFGKGETDEADFDDRRSTSESISTARSKSDKQLSAEEKRSLVRAWIAVEIET